MPGAGSPVPSGCVPTSPAFEKRLHDVALVLGRHDHIVDNLSLAPLRPRGGMIISGS
jgi:hypothetical protein